MEDLNDSDEVNSIEPIENTFPQSTKIKKGFVEKKFGPLKWTISVYHIFFAIWASYYLLRILLLDISNLIYAVPAIVFIAASFTGAVQLLQNKTSAYNYLIVAQIPQAVVLHLKSLLYFLLIGQWIVLRIGWPRPIGIDFGIKHNPLDLNFYTFKNGRERRKHK